MRQYKSQCCCFSALQWLRCWAICLCFALHANSFIIRPLSREGLKIQAVLWLDDTGYTSPFISMLILGGKNRLLCCTIWPEDEDSVDGLERSHPTNWGPCNHAGCMYVNNCVISDSTRGAVCMRVVVCHQWGKYWASGVFICSYVFWLSHQELSAIQNSWTDVPWIQWCQIPIQPYMFVQQRWHLIFYNVWWFEDEKCFNTSSGQDDVEFRRQFMQFDWLFAEVAHYGL